ncbi:PREDICTED: HMG domain-containing protein 4 isoform X2 [Nanorana parkeri]|uniref:HMG domain-containing protein 4 isoform X2 n=1 Tax=Nanorana parkeri TaxID=125878 RepID=UPI0008544FC6|nr:PREDICTED: HMG domain-containing protein 4 isoform X2 [Nanorana parkeri]
MAYSDSREILDPDRGMEDVSLAAGRSQREKKRSYKDLLREEEEIAEQVRKSSKKRSKDTDFTLLPSDSHKKKKKHSSDDAYFPELSSDVKKKKKHTLPSSSSPSSDTAMDLLNSISSPVVSSSKHSSKKNEKILASPVGLQSSVQVTRKEHRKKGGEDTVEDLSHKSKKPKPLTLREPEGLKMKLIISPKEKTSERPLPTQENPLCSDKSSSKKSKKSKDETEKSSHKKHKRESHTPRHAGTPDTASSSGGELEAGELVIDDSVRETKKKKKSKKSKKKKDKHKEDKHRKHSKSKREHGLESSKPIAPSVLPSSPNSRAATSSPPPLPSPPATALLPTPVVLSHPEGTTDKKKKKEEAEKQPKKKNMSAYQVFSKEYRSSIISEHPGIDFGELSKKLAEVWKQLPEKDKLVWKQKAQYLQHKQNKAEATTVKRKPSPSESTSKSKGSPSSSSLPSPHKKSSSSTVSFSSSPAKVPDTEPIDVAAHLQLLGESLSLIGHRLQETEGMVAVSGSLSVLLDSVLCALGPLVCLTSHVPQLNACPKQVLSNTLDNIAYVMPGL